MVRLMVRLRDQNEVVGLSRRKRRRIRAINIGPALLTLGNLLSGFAAIHFCSRPVVPPVDPIHNLSLACYMIFAAMLCDALDGRLARFSRTTSEFGAQLDSLADVVSFGAAPGFIVIRLIIAISQGPYEISPGATTAFGRFCWIAAGAYLACGALRLARFNVENVSDESSHMAFRGLPIPGAAGALVSLILLNLESLRPVANGDVSGLGHYSAVLAAAVPWVVIILGLLMVSRLPYVHVVNRFLRGKKPFWMVVAAAFGILAFLLWPELAVTLCGYALSGPVSWLVRFVARFFVGPSIQEEP